MKAEMQKIILLLAILGFAVFSGEKADSWVCGVRSSPSHTQNWNISHHLQGNQNNDYGRMTRLKE
jgi:hypothetical protein